MRELRRAQKGIGGVEGISGGLAIIGDGISKEKKRKQNGDGISKEKKRERNTEGK